MSYNYDEDWDFILGEWGPTRSIETYELPAQAPVCDDCGYSKDELSHELICETLD